VVGVDGARGKDALTKMRHSDNVLREQEGSGAEEEEKESKKEEDQ